MAPFCPARIIHLPAQPGQFILKIDEKIVDNITMQQRQKLVAIDIVPPVNILLYIFPIHLSGNGQSI